MESSSAAAAAASEEGCRAAIWSATTNWIADGSLDDAISFDTSEEIEDEQEAKPVLLLRPETDDPPPCEITICFRKKHEIYRVYVRSTARVYEMYYSSDHEESNKEYLCTVRCGAAVKEVLADSVTVRDTNGCKESLSNGIVAIPEKVTRNNSNSSDEDGWVQVKAPNTVMQDGKEYSVSKNCDNVTIHYEATAEISDSSPCYYLTLRLLSIQTKACVHVEEIYVYADPVESSDSDPPVSASENLGGSSLLSMLVPSLMQLSKSENRQNNCFSKEATVLKYQNGIERTDQTASLGVENSVAQETYSCKSLDQERTNIKSDVRLESKKEVSALHQMPNSFDQSNNWAYNRLEKVLDELVLKVGRVETFCSKFEENMLKPLSCMEQRLQEMEQKLDALAVKNQSSEQCPCSRVSASESNGYDVKNNNGNTKDTGSGEDTSSVAVSSPGNMVEPSVAVSQTRPGLTIKAPEFLNEDDDCSNTGDTVDPFIEDFPKSKKPLSIDSVLESSLAAFLTSTAAKSLDSIPNQTTLPQESVNSNNSALDNLVTNSSERVGCDSLGATRKRTCFCDSLVCPRNLEMVNLNMVTEGTTFDDSDIVANLDVFSPACPSEANSGSIVMPSEFLNMYSSSSCNDTLNSPDLDCTEQCPKIICARFSAPSEISSIGSNDLSASTTTVCDGADVSRIENQEENEMKDEVHLDPILSMSHFEDTFEQVDQTGVERSQGLSIEKAGGELATDLHDGTLTDLNEGVSQNCHDTSSADNGDVEKAALHDSDEHSRELIEDRGSTCSSFHETDPAFDVKKSFSHADDTGGFSQEKSNKELEETIFNVNFTHESNWVSGLPLELLLCGAPDGKLPVVSTAGGDKEQLNKLSSSGGINCERDNNGVFLPEVSSHPEGPLCAGK
ncbi:uncharacterized protein LOC109833722 isoform X2 [Asparagus officinalis]|uniref:uncharacterized protein LOC109833722 isoform X2 n=1 Tax=Asparagus officinalis TaxID=4686 RepID=UPI00098E15C9|nr:uncharacterized protein LOC109833722 isoform X2 [Asparagus officinalis]